jgi:predicted AAA+ superfamily ATPase
MNQYLPRLIDSTLLEWKEAIKHKPLLLRGARQVGKSSAVRHLASKFDYFLEVNFERMPQFKELFTDDLDVKRIARKLSALTDIPIEAGKTLLFLDEIQMCREAISSLRFFYEDYPELHVVAAGSLLEFALREIPTFGVGRIRSLFVYPMTFDEFLMASGSKGLLEEKRRASPQHPLMEVFHQKLVEQFRMYLLVGGMPESVATWVGTGDYQQCRQVQDDILLSYEDDFGKYKARVDPQLLRLTLRGVAHQIGEKMMYSRISREHRSAQLKEAMELLKLAGLVTPVTHTSANGLPLGAEANDSYTKYLYLDSGLLLRILDMELGDTREQTEQILLGSATDLVNKGHHTEMVAGLELLRYRQPTHRQELYFWMRTEKNSLAEVDYLTVRHAKVLPIEVKAGTKGGMKSLFSFMNDKHVEVGVRTSLENFGEIVNGEKRVEVWPLYALAGIGETMK